MVRTVEMVFHIIRALILKPEVVARVWVVKMLAVAALAS